MESTGRKTIEDESAGVICRILALPVKPKIYILAIVLLFFALCFIVFAGEPVPRGCELENGLFAELNLSKKQCEHIRQLYDEFRNKTAVLRGKIIEKRIVLKNLYDNPNTNPQAIQSNEHELNLLEREFERQARQTESKQKRYLTPEQREGMKDIRYGFSPRGYGMKKGYGTHP